MQKFSFGARDNSIIQFAYTVDDIQEGMRRYTDLLRIGPWFLIGPFVPAKGVYRGAVTTMRISLAVAFAGEAMVELIEQHDETPSVYRETLRRAGRTAFTTGRSAPGISTLLSPVSRTKVIPQRFQTYPPAAFASSISTRRATCPACSRSSR